MNYGRQFSVPDEPFCYWIPATPQKPAVLVRLEGSNSAIDPLVRGDFQKIYVGQTQNFNGVAQMQEGGNVEYFCVDGSLAGNNHNDNARSLGEDSADWNRNISFTELLQNGNETVVPSGNNSLSRHLEMAANQPLRPKLQPESVNWGSNGFEMGLSSNGNCGSNGFELGSGSNGLEMGLISNGNCGSNGFELGSGSNGNWGSNGLEMGLISNGNCGSNGFELGSGSNGNWGSNGFEMSLISNGNCGSNGFEMGLISNGNCGSKGFELGSGSNGNWGSNGFELGSGSNGTLVERPQANPYGDNLWIDLNSSNDTLQSEQSHCQTSNLQTNGDISQRLQYGYDLNSSPGEETGSFTKVANSLQFTPITPYQSTKLDSQNPALLQSRVDDSTRQGKDRAGNLITYEKVIEHRDELSQNVVDSSSTVVSLPSAEKKDSDKRVLESGIDLNKTPAQKPAKRKKHRPKVVVEGKPKRTRKPAIPRNGEPKENRAKRKYVRKKKDSTTQQVDIPKGTTDLNNETAPKNSRRNLEFDLENIRDQNLGTIVAPREELQQSNQRAPNTTTDLQATELCSGTNYVSETMPVGQRGMPERWQMVNRETGSTSNSIPSANQLPNGYIPPPTGGEAPSTPLSASVVMQMKNFYAIGRHGSDRITDQNQRTEHVSTPSQQHTRAKGRGSKRANCHTSEQAHLCTTNSMGWFPGKGIFQVSECQRNSCTQSIDFSQPYKRNKIGNGMLSNTTAATGTGNGPVQIARNVNREGLESARSNSYTESHKFSKEVNYLVDKITTKGYIHSNASGYNSPRQRIPSEPHSLTERMGCTRPLSRLHSYSSQTTIDKSNHLQPSPLVNSTGAGNSQLYQTYCDSISAKKQTEGSSVLKPVLYGVEEVLQQNRSSKNQQPAPKRKGRTKKQTRAITVDDIIYLFKALNLNGISNELQNHDRNAIVPYKGLGAIVPYEESEFIKKRKARPKVDLDPETNRIWNLLMGKEESKDTEGTDEAKEKWWENERNVFRGRVDSFIARMHLVQGDRRFSRWKGSVVDSVIGVFLTQNVSDHLSSSAFMSLAARFPLKPSNHDTRDKVETSILAKEPEISMLNPNDKIKWSEVSCQSTSNPSVMRYESAEHQWGSETSRTGKTLVEAQSQRLVEVFVLSQDSVDSSITQVSGVIKSCTGFNSEAEGPCTGYKPRNAQASSSTGLTQTENTTKDGKVYGHITESSVLNGKINHLGYPSSFTSPNNPEYLHMQVNAARRRDNELHMTTKSGVPAVGCFEAYSDESISSWSSTTSRSTKGKDESYRSLTGGLAGNSGDSSLQQNKPWMSQKTPTNLHALSANSTHQGISQAYHIGHNQSYSNSYQHKTNHVSHLESASSKEPAENAESLTKMQNATVENVPNVSELTEKISEAGDSNSVVHMQTHKEQSSVESNGDTNAKTSKAKKGNSESKKKNSVDWDYLRRQVETNGREKERSKEVMDSLDYEAVRLANVNEISQAIKERGMNNMLAERIKDFLNRLVRDHGSIDLEWLRDVPPDKAKDFLLSIRGLGLKSVECVRLLTLHNLAFPVDTNVGRIAVRLGWVPLQPLPESLQLHLLEMYPILESIQKYLWPRLCKLDQRTLYELHYQMITFGKVFCTKSKPNCNACPMRGECRHFASAFASARLALPGPEEKSSTGPLVANNAPLPPPENNSLNEPLPPPENNSLNEAVREIGNCEPIIEEPATPEQEFTEISQTDIEDFYEEDPDEIPTIKLDIKEFTVNIQNYMQGNMDLQEVDMSKALVALNPEATIPMPKLKNISRLRTEHQVYELPDSHPLLEGRDKREPDDPSPYLLAIWTPGETATMIQPPEGSCTSKEENKLCNEKTCFSCNSVREAHSQTVRGTILIPCRTAMRGSFPLNGTYFQVNEMFADHDSSLNPIDVPREWIWNLPRRMVYFGTSVTSIFKGLSTEGIQFCFWRGFVCVRGFDQRTRAPKPLIARLHFPTSKLVKKKDDSK
ncbi:hypothetical protein UlMin_026122 [Ulmus minor]